ncbi:hypothetical protein RFI_12126 [Reticulomyxa filosa]|uniref:Uncharacterized protein n=1 Tax=Reticulomyxa filosa TaxID=46433 RepID=X6NGA4_RETFI|nr:hypothetical protein RFI_12126 [Reticulomyxa filosa]|eukprot:ETO25016.1 hypothetical protein RFI_12126 [Reticulomyxa filosa]
MNNFSCVFITKLAKKILHRECISLECGYLQCLKCCFGVFVITFLLLFFVLYYAHYLVICPFHSESTSDSLKTCHMRSFRNYIMNFIEIPDHWSDIMLTDAHTNEFQRVAEKVWRYARNITNTPNANRLRQGMDKTYSMYNQALCHHSKVPLFRKESLLTECFQSKNETNDLPLLHFSVLLGQRRGGSNWAQYTLETHPQIHTLHEKTWFWFKRHCTRFGWYGAKCDGYAMIEELHKWFIWPFIEGKIKCKDIVEKNERKVVLQKLEIEQFLVEHYPIFAEYVYCNNISVIHWRRAATIASFWSYQADSIERLYTKELYKIIRRNRRDNLQRAHISELSIDSKLGHKYVQDIDYLHEQIKIFLKFYPFNQILYQEFFYEDFLGKFHLDYWKSLQAFLNVSYFVNGSSWIVREHPIPCYKKISNWDLIKNSLIESDSYYACQMEHN